ncbi:hypothetical protein HDU93_007699 [Gonapodya sp. JEL0774]|nr:hypothetical protein HDU93_007699 [Gonapodya sp. JEL0774]
MKGLNVTQYGNDHKDVDDILDSFSLHIVELQKSPKPAVAYTPAAASKVSGFAEQIKNLLFPHLDLEEKHLFSESELRKTFSLEEVQAMKKHQITFQVKPQVRIKIDKYDGGWDPGIPIAETRHSVD